MNDELVHALKSTAKGIEGTGSAFNAALLRRAADDVAQGGPTASLLAPWRGQDFKTLIKDAVPVRLAAAWHELVLSGDAPALAAAYAKQVVAKDIDAAWASARRSIEEHGERITAFMGHEPQTNEVRRSVGLVGGFLTVAHETGLPLRCFEVGASAGLNSAWDRYFYRLGDVSWGDPASALRLDCDWRGRRPPIDADVRVVERGACDRRPTDLSDIPERRRLLSYLWPDQLERMARARDAIAAALNGPITVEQADAVEWTKRKAAPKAGAATVIFHSVFWQYMPAGSQAALRAVIEGFGQAATKDAPFAWLRMEPPADDMAKTDVMLTLWPGDGKTRTVGHVHPHGAWMDWLG